MTPLLCPDWCAASRSVASMTATDRPRAANDIAVDELTIPQVMTATSYVALMLGRRIVAVRSRRCSVEHLETRNWHDQAAAPFAHVVELGADLVSQIPRQNQNVVWARFT